MLAFEGVGVKVGVNVSVGVKVGVKVAVIVGVRVAGDVSVMVGVSVGRPVGVGTGGKELPQMLGTAPQPDTMNASSKTVTRFRGISPKNFGMRMTRKHEFYLCSVRSVKSVY